jgi:xanthine dehydrogenase accessory factor
MTPHAAPGADADADARWPTSADEAVRLAACDWAADGTAAIIVEVGRVKGSVPREAGTRMLVAADRVVGTVGGGHLEWEAIAMARARLAEAGNDAADGWDWTVALGPSLGQCCGGALTLHFAPLTLARADAWPRPPERFHLHLFGAGHVGRAVVRLLADLPCSVQWTDVREAEFPPGPLPPHIAPVCVDAADLAGEVQQAPANACFLVMTHSHDLDAAITEAVLRRGDFRFLGLIGSQTKRARFMHRFEARGMPVDALARLTCPIGVPGIEGKAPEVVALAVVAQLLQLRP